MATLIVVNAAEDYFGEWRVPAIQRIVKYWGQMTVETTRINVNPNPKPNTEGDMYTSIGVNKVHDKHIAEPPKHLLHPNCSRKS